MSSRGGKDRLSRKAPELFREWPDRAEPGLLEMKIAKLPLGYLNAEEEGNDHHK
jgi:hypothetical protein